MRSNTLAENLSKGDANKLRSWWDANTKFYHFVVKMDNSKFYKLVRESNQPTKENYLYERSTM